MRSHPSVVIVGAGAIGLACAWQLSERGVRHVTVIDTDYPASGSSGQSIGIVHTQHLAPLDIELRVVAKRLFDRLADDYGLELTRNGCVRLGFDAEQLERFERSVAIQQELGIDDARVLDRDELHAMVPEMRVDDVVGGLYGPSDGFVDGHALCRLLLELIEVHGVVVMPRTRITGAERTTDGRHRVHTSRLAIEADMVVNAAGVWAPRVAESLGTVAPLRAERHQAVMAKLPTEPRHTMPCVMTYASESGTDGLCFRHERPDRLVVGLHALDPMGEVVDPESYARSNDFGFLEAVAERLQHRLPGFDGVELGGGWVGLYPVSHDGTPLVGPSPGQPTVVSACAAGRAGVMLAPVVGRLVADWVLDGRPVCAPSAAKLSPGRLSVGQIAGASGA